MAAISSQAAAAHVFEITDDGSLVTRDGGGAAAPTDAEGGSGDDSSVAEAAPDVAPAALTEASLPAIPAALAPALLGAAARYGVSPSLLAALITRESAWRADAVSSKGAIGLAQLMPATARALAVDPHDPAANIDGAAHYLRKMLDLFDGNVERALAAYNAGPMRVLRANGVPAIAETRTYVATIIDRLATSTPVTALRGAN